MVKFSCSRSLVPALVLLVLGLGVVPVAAAGGDGWQTYKDAKFGFAMKVPKGAKLKEREWPGGWGGLYGKVGDVEVLGIAKLGAQHSPGDIERYGVTVTGIAEEHWKVIDQGKDSNGWKWFKAAVVTDGETVLFGGYGVGPKGSYLIFLKTSAEDYEENESEYEKWYDSIELT
jgi:hypothetical protein